jgi:hypothetical protein
MVGSEYKASLTHPEELCETGPEAGTERPVTE